jgi:hypothetical protein
VLLIWDTQSADTASLVSALTAAGDIVDASQTPFTGYDGTNPPLAGYDGVILLDAAVTGDMPASGQAALESFVHNGGGFIHDGWASGEWRNVVRHSHRHERSEPWAALAGRAASHLLF